MHQYFLMGEELVKYLVYLSKINERTKADTMELMSAVLVIRTAKNPLICFYFIFEYGEK
jgi:TPP-dependent trihydroxycyclohexane-1,2-dione (THcHDO) dehydratase